jgi:hypothetical protein
MTRPEIPSSNITRRDFIRAGAHAAAGVAATAALGTSYSAAAAAESAGAIQPAPDAAQPMPTGMIGKVKLSRMLLGGNLVGGWMHCRDLKYVGALFRAYVTEEKMLQTFHLAEQHGINTVFETGADFVKKYNERFNGHLQFIPHIKVTAEQTDAELKDQLKELVDTGAVALYVWGVSSDRLMEDGMGTKLAKAVETSKAIGLPIGVGSHSLQVPKYCEKERVPCDFYVKTLHSDNYPSATPKALRKDFMWQNQDPIFYDNMWCIDPEETIAFMKTVTKPWLAFKVLAAGAIYPRDGFQYAFKNGADFIAVGMFDFQIKENSQLLCKVVRANQARERPWRA